MKTHMGRLLLIVSALVALVVFYASDDRSGAPSVTGGELLLPTLKNDLDKVDRIVITGAGEQTSLERSQDGWTIAERGGFPAAFDRVAELLRGLAAARTVEPGTAREEFMDRLGLQDPEAPDSRATLVALRIEGQNEPSLRVLLGDEASGRSGRYVRLPAEAQSWLIDNNPQADATPADWLQRALFELDSPVRSLSRSMASGDGFVATRPVGDDGEGSDSLRPESLPEGRSLSFEGVFDASARAALGARLEDVERADAYNPPAESLVSTELQLSDGLQLSFSAFESDTGKWLRVRASVAEWHAPDDADIDARVEAINARLDGWSLRVSDYTYTELSKGFQAYLKAEEPTQESTDAD